MFRKKIILKITNVIKGIDNLKITHLAIEESGAFEVSSAENIIKVLKNT